MGKGVTSFVERFRVTLMQTFVFVVYWLKKRLKIGRCVRLYSCKVHPVTFALLKSHVYVYCVCFQVHYFSAKWR